MAAEGVLFLGFLLLALVAPLVLYAIVSAEADDTERMDRESAERRVRKDGDSGTADEPDGDDYDPWGDRDDDRNGWN